MIVIIGQDVYGLLYRHPFTDDSRIVLEFRQPFVRVFKGACQFAQGVDVM